MTLSKTDLLPGFSASSPVPSQATSGREGTVPFPQRRSTAFFGLAGLVLLSALAAFTPAEAYEADVHFGLTKWLALQAGFDDGQAESIAIGDQRVDSGSMDNLEAVLEYACVGRFDDVARDVQRRHFPSSTKLPAAPAERAVVAGGAAAREHLSKLLSVAAGKEDVLLAHLGVALHALQDSWSHAGVPGVPTLGAGLRCDGTLASGHADNRGGPDAHDADLTHKYPADIAPMAKATYEALVAYPRVRKIARDAAPWEKVAAELEAFARARTKTDKRDWFTEHRIEETGFLAGISIPDGPRPGTLVFEGRRLPPLRGPTSNQHDAPDDVKRFFDALLRRWLGSEPIDDLVAEVAEAATPASDAKGKRRLTAAERELAARLKLWKLKDHGSAAQLAHEAAPFSAAQMQAVERLTSPASRFVGPISPEIAFFPLLAKGEYASPLLPYIVRELPPAASGETRMIAIARPVHAPYDTLGFVVQAKSGRWVLVDVVAAIDH
jgi:hypothetical protein